MLRLLKKLLRLVGIYAKYRVIRCTDLPDKPSDEKLYIVGEEGVYWLAAMKCPCGCGDLIQLSLSENSHPRWRLAGTDTQPTLFPSINRTVGCKSHFHLRNGSVLWCP